MIKELPTEIQFQFFSILFQSTHTLDEINDYLIDPSWFENTPGKSSQGFSPMWYVLTLLLHRFAIDINEKSDFILFTTSVYA
ncbi:unnamed protein product [Ambrosiozyma monospora]|uniref:Unnamed protein product n=1 Tax=Ambrosiozyma monospora TaxID=43982 RepID=A0ACB5UF78_AMBMO|nr:unnamed protein product [Ambrosiozyma monospora]